MSYSIQIIDLSFFDDFYLFFIYLCLRNDLSLIALAFALLYEHFYCHDNHDNHIHPNISENQNDKAPPHSVAIVSFVIYNKKYEYGVADEVECGFVEDLGAVEHGRVKGHGWHQVAQRKQGLQHEEDQLEKWDPPQV